jgi:hypothetical protein
MPNKKIKKDPKKSLYDQSRDTVGKIYRDLHLNKSNPIIEVGDMTNSLIPDLVDDINDALKDGTKDFGGRPFYVLIHEKKDLQMKDALLRRIFKQLYRPYPEDDTTVFWHDPAAFETRFCWSLPHWSEMDNMLNSYKLYDNNLIAEIRAWKSYDLYHFGFEKDNMGNWKPNPNWKDHPLKKAS